MSDNASLAAIQQLRAIEEQSRSAVSNLPTVVDDEQFSEGLLISLLDKRMIIPVKDVKEVLNYPSSVTPVPGTKNWVLGIANIRGNLLPLVDLQRFLGGGSIHLRRRSRIVVINHHDRQVGVLVGDIYGVRQLGEEQQIEMPEELGETAKYVAGAFEVEGERLPAFSMTRLSESAGFQVAAA